MKRYRFFNFYIDATRNPYNHDTPNSSLVEMIRKENRGHINSEYGDINFDKKFDRWLSFPKPVLSVIHEHTQLINDIEHAYIIGGLYSALTGACCLGERIFNQVILGTKDFYKFHSRYKEIYNKNTIINWDLAISILKEWDIIDDDTEHLYRRLAEVRNDSIHFMNKNQDLEEMAKEAIELICQIISHLFGLNEHNKKYLLLFDVPGEIYLRKDAEKIPFVKAFFIPSAALVGYKYKLVNNKLTGIGYMVAEPKEGYENEEITDEEFVKLRKEFSNK